MEYFRRISVVVLMCLTVWLFFYAPLYPLVRIKPVDFEADFKKEIRRPKWTSESLLPRENAVALSYEQFVAQKTKGSVFNVQGDEWEALFISIKNAYDGLVLSKELQRRMAPQYKKAGFYFYASESPFNTLQDRLKKHLDTIYLSFPNGQYMKVDYKAYDNSSFYIGSGLLDYPKPPSWLMYPYRKFCPFIMLAAVALYVFLPREKKKKDSIYFKTWFIVGNDVSFVVFLIVLPFAAPMAIMGGSFQVFFTEGIFLIPVFWLIASIGVWGLVFIMPRFASFVIDITADGIKSVDTRGEHIYQFKDMQYYQWVTFKRPRWMVFFAFIFLLSGRGGGISFFVLSTLTHAGIGIRLKDGTLFYINTSNPMGQSVLNKNEAKIVKTLNAKGIIEKEGEIVIRSMGLEPAGIKKL